MFNRLLFASCILTLFRMGLNHPQPPGQEQAYFEGGRPERGGGVAGATKSKPLQRLINSPKAKDVSLDIPMDGSWAGQEGAALIPVFGFAVIDGSNAQETSHAPSDTASHAPSDSASHAPSAATSHAPSDSTSHAPSAATSHAPDAVTTAISTGPERGHYRTTPGCGGADGPIHNIRKCTTGTTQATKRVVSYVTAIPGKTDKSVTEINGTLVVCGKAN